MPLATAQKGINHCATFAGFRVTNEHSIVLARALDRTFVTSVAALPRSSNPNCLWPHGWAFAGERDRPGCRFRRRAANRFQTEWVHQRMAHRPRASVYWTAGASAARPRFRTHGNLSHHECFLSARKRRRRSRSAGAVQNYSRRHAGFHLLRVGIIRIPLEKGFAAARSATFAAKF